MVDQFRALAIQRVKELDVLKMFPPDKVNLLIPETGYITSPSPLQDILISYIRLKPEEAHELKEGKDVRYMPSAPQLNQIANSAGVEWLVDQQVRSDEPGVWKHMAQASYIKANGQRVQTGRMLYVLDLRPGGTVEAQIRMQQTAQAHRALEPDAKYCPWALKAAVKNLKGGTPEYGLAVSAYIEGKVEAEMTMKRRHAAALAQTGAQDRAIRKLFNLKSSYSREEMERDWIIATSTKDEFTMMKELGVADLLRNRMADRIEREANVLFGLEDAPAPTITNIETIEGAATELDVETEEEAGDIEIEEEPAPEEIEEPPAGEPAAPPAPPSPAPNLLTGEERNALLKRCDGLGYNQFAVKGLIPSLFGENEKLDTLTRPQSDNLWAYVEYAGGLKGDPRLADQSIPAEGRAAIKKAVREQIDAAKEVVKLAYAAGGVAVFAPEMKAETAGAV